MEKEFVERFATEWIESWNAHDVDRVLSHYAEDFEMSSPVIIQVAGEPSGTLKGKAAVGAYWRRALDLVPDLQFELLSVLAGVSSITLYYKGARGRLAAEVFHFGSDQKVTRAFAIPTWVSGSTTLNGGMPYSRPFPGSSRGWERC